MPKLLASFSVFRVEAPWPEAAAVAGALLALFVLLRPEFVRDLLLHHLTAEPFQHAQHRVISGISIPGIRGILALSHWVSLLQLS